MDFEGLLRKTWGGFVNQILTLILFTLLGAVLCITIVLIPTVTRGLTKGFLDYAREGKQPDYALLWDFKDFGQMALVVIIVGVALSIGYTLCIIPGVLLNIFFLYCVLYMVDKNMGAIEGITASKDLVMKTGFGTNLIVTLIIVLLFFIGTLVALGWVLTAPFSFLFLTYVYLELSQKETAAPPAQA